MSATDIEDVVAWLDVERVYRATVLIPGFARHDERDQSPQRPFRMACLFGDEAGPAHIC
jgi:hypothetical protein